jgi:hypothetical protein
VTFLELYGEALDVQLASTDRTQLAHRLAAVEHRLAVLH